MSDNKQQSMTRWAIYHVSREFAKEHGNPVLGYVNAESKEQAEELAAKNGQIASRACPGAGLWAVRVREEDERERKR
jgi:hypothetical protein